MYFYRQNPNNVYPAFWWFDYGIRNVGAMLTTLEEREFLILEPPEDSVASLKVEEIKRILKSKGLKTTERSRQIVSNNKSAYRKGKNKNI